MAEARNWFSDAGRTIYHVLFRIIPDVPALAVRFPWPMAALTILIAVLAVNDASLVSLSQSSPPLQILQPVDNVVLGLIAAVLGLTALTLAAESLGWAGPRLHGLSLLLCLAIAAIVTAAIGRWSWMLPSLHLLALGTALAVCGCAALGWSRDRVQYSIARSVSASM